MISIACAIIGHVILTAGTAPSVHIRPKSAITAFIIAIIVFGLGTGGFKPNISPLIAEQTVGEKLRVITNKKGKRVIVPAPHYNWYLFINVDALG